MIKFKSKEGNADTVSTDIERSGTIQVIRLRFYPCQACRWCEIPDLRH